MWISEYIYFNFFRKLLIVKLFWILFVCSGLLFVSSQSSTSFNISEDVDWNDAILVFLYNTQHLKVGLKHLFLIVLSHLWGVVLSYMTSRKNVIFYSFIFCLHFENFQILFQWNIIPALIVFPRKSHSLILSLPFLFSMGLLSCKRYQKNPNKHRHISHQTRHWIFCL